MKPITESLMENFDFFQKQDLSGYAGRWVIIVNRKIAGSGDNLKLLMEEVKNKYPDDEPFVVRAPTGRALIL